MVLVEELCRAEVMAPPSVTGVRLRGAACVLGGWLTRDSLWHNASPVQQRGHALAAVQGGDATLLLGGRGAPPRE